MQIPSPYTHRSRAAAVDGLARQDCLSEHSSADEAFASASWLRLPEEVQIELADLLDRYASHLESGDEAEAERLLHEHPELQQHMGGHLESLRWLCRATRKPRGESSPAAAPVIAPPLRATDTVPATLGDYRIENEIGRGGMGIVYSATQISLRRRVALKVLPFAAVLDQQQVARFRNEAQAAASLHHPHIVPVFAVGCERGVHYYSMQFIDGQTLEQLIHELRGANRPGPLHQHSESLKPKVVQRTTLAVGQRNAAPAAAEARDTIAEPKLVTKRETGATHATLNQRDHVRAMVSLMIDVADALDYAHQQGVVHRDVKPSNLLLDSSGKVWIADFGLARCRGVQPLTAHGNLMGTALYMSPEQVSGRPQEVDHRTDIYSFGVTLYELLTGQRVFNETNRERLLNAIETREPLSPRKYNAAIPVDLETIILKTLSKRREDRYLTAGELADDLRRYLQGLPTRARRPSVRDRVAKWMIRRQSLVLTAIVFMTFVVLGLSLTTWLVARESYQRKLANQRAQLHLDQAHHAVDRFSGLLASRLQNIPGTDGLRAEMLREAERFYSDFLSYAESDAEHGRHVGHLEKVRFRLAKVLTQLGRSEDAESQYVEAISGLTAALKQPAATISKPELQADLALCFQNLAALRKQQGRYDAAQAGYEQAIALQNSLRKSETLVQRIVPEWSSTQTNLAMLLHAMGADGQALALLEQVHRTLNEYAVDLPAQSVTMALVECRNAMVAVCLESAPEEAQRLLESNLCELEALREEADRWDTDREGSDRPGTARELAVFATRQLAITRNNLATLLCNQDRVSEASELLDQTVIELQQLLHDVGPDAEMRQQLAIAHSNRGRAQFGLDRSGRMLDEFIEAERLLREEQHRQPQHADTRHRLAGVLHNRSVVLRHGGDVNQSMEVIAEAIELQASAIKAAPANVTYRQSLESHRKQLDLLVSDLQIQVRQAVPQQPTNLKPVAIVPVKKTAALETAQPEHATEHVNGQFNEQTNERVNGAVTVPRSQAESSQDAIGSGGNRDAA